MSRHRDHLLKRCRCEATKWPKCPHSWHLVLRHDGARFSISLDVYAKRRGLPHVRLRGEAETLAGRIVGEIRHGTYQARPNAHAASDAERGLTFDQLWPKFVATVLVPKELESRADEEGRYRKMADVVVERVRFGARLVTAITEEAIETMFAAVTKGKANHTKRKYRRGLKRLFRWAVLKQHLPASPITEETVLHAGAGVMRTRRVRPDEEARLVQAASDGRSDAATRLATLILAALDLGARLGELLALQWRDLLWDEGRVQVRAVERGARKNRKPRQIPLTGRLTAALRACQTSPLGRNWPDDAYVFGDAIGSRVTKIRKAWVTCVLRAHGVPLSWRKRGALSAEVLARFQAIDLHFHDLRHECALRWLEKGYTLSTIASLLGHSNLDTLRVYLGIEQEDALAEAERINAEHPAAEVGIRPRGRKTAANRPQTRATVLTFASETKEGS